MIHKDFIMKRDLSSDDKKLLNRLLLVSGEAPNVVKDWKGSDSKELFENKIGTDLRPFHNKQYNYWKDKKIEYKYNEYGFRSNDNFEGEGIVCLGCSYTEGIGLPIEYNWGYKLAKALNTKHFNLGQAGLGLDSAYRLLLGFGSKLKFKKVFLLVPPPFRYEWIVADNKLVEPYLIEKPDLIQWLVQSMGSNKHIKPKYEKFFKSFLYGGEMNDSLRESRGVHAIRGLCDELGVEFFYKHYHLTRIEKENLKEGIPARDGHPCSAQQELYFNSFLKMVNENN